MKSNSTLMEKFSSYFVTQWEKQSYIATDKMLLQAKSRKMLIEVLTSFLICIFSYFFLCCKNSFS